MAVIVGGIVEKSGKYLLVQEAKEKCYGKWNLPAGRLEHNESVVDAARREIMEETGCNVEITGICHIINKVLNDDIFISFIFKTKLIKENIKFNKNEILSVKWFTYDEILSMKDELCSPSLIIGAINNSVNNAIMDIETIQIIK